MRGHNGVLFTGKVFGRLTVIAEPFIPPNKKFSFAPCRCRCGKQKTIRVSDLLRGNTVSCGCRRSEMIGNRSRTHAKTGSRAFELWLRIKSRCFNPRFHQWKDYGGRGITMHPAWRDSFEAFYRDVGDPPRGQTLDRKNNDGHYEPGNVRFTDRITQANNMRTNRLLTFKGQTKTITQWARHVGVTAATLFKRIEHGWTIERVLTTPTQGGGK